MKQQQHWKELSVIHYTLLLFVLFPLFSFFFHQEGIERIKDFFNSHLQHCFVSAYVDSRTINKRRRKKAGHRQRDPRYTNVRFLIFSSFLHAHCLHSTIHRHSKKYKNKMPSHVIRALKATKKVEEMLFNVQSFGKPSCRLKSEHSAMCFLIEICTRKACC